MTDTIHIDNPDQTIRAIANATFPEYTGRKFRIRIASHPLDVRSYWSGGSRSYFAFVNLATMEQSGEVPVQSAFDTPIKGAESVSLPDGFACVEHSIFCGKDAGLTIHVPASNAANLLPAPIALTRDETIVLAATAGLKSSYAGISDYRQHEAMRETGITSADYQSAKAALIARKLLNGAGAITASGRNAIGRIRLHDLR